MLSHTTGSKGITAVLCIDTCTVDIDLRLLSSIHGSHDDLCRELFTRIKCRLLRNHESINLIDTHILHVYVRYQGMEHLTLCMTYVALQLGEKGDSCCHRHTLKHILLPVLTHGMGILRDTGRQVTGDYLPLTIVRNHLQDTLTEGIDRIEEIFSVGLAGCCHHLSGCL